MQDKTISSKSLLLPDIVVFSLLSTLIYGVVLLGYGWREEFHPVASIDLSLSALPYYTLLSAMRGMTAYLISLSFTLVVGYSAAKNKTAERMIIPLLDILQSVPVLAFLPGLLLGLVALFPRSYFGLELAAILMIFTGQVWNMTFSYYSSLKSLPNDFKEAATLMGLSPFQRWFRVELPFSAMNLAWNSVLSMAGGWFFLIPCEAMTLGAHEYRLPGIGAYMAVAIQTNQTKAIWGAAFAMVSLIFVLDFVIWRPILAWTRRFRLEEIPGVAPPEPLMQVWIRESHIIYWLKVLYRDYLYRHGYHPMKHWASQRAMPRWLKGKGSYTQPSYFPALMKVLVVVLIGLFGYVMTSGAFRLVQLLSQVSGKQWLMLARDSIWTLLRVFAAVALSTLWAVPVGIWLGTSEKRIRIAQPVIQIFASFPAPMIYPLILSTLFALGVNFAWGSVILMLLGIQWYVLFNVLAGALRIPLELLDAINLMKLSTWDKWKRLYLPSVFPSLATGWVTAAGGAWNASVVAEYLPYGGEILKTGGLGADLSVATTNEDFPLFAASLMMMILMVILTNRTVWGRVYRIAQTRYRMEF